MCGFGWGKMYKVVINDLILFVSKFVKNNLGNNSVLIRHLVTWVSVFMRNNLFHEGEIKINQSLE